MKRISKKTILQLLEQLYPDAGPELIFSNPYETLIAVMLSAQCTDAQVNKVTPTLFQRYPDPESLAHADVQDVYQIVRSCGFKSKADHIVAACRLIMSEYNRQVPDQMEELIKLPGVGRKTANVVLATAFNQPAIPVDTHVFRVANRLGLADAADVRKTEEQLQKAIPRKNWSKAHHWLIFHGRRVCHAQRPACGSCALNQECKYALSKNKE